jgi:TPR repeat protein
VISMLSFIPILWLAAGPAPVSAQGTAMVTDCDRLAAYPDDPHRVGPGSTREQIDLPQARAACEADVAAQTGNPRLRYQLARILFYQGDTRRAVDEMRHAADLGYAQAQFVYGTFISKQRPDAPTDICLTERYWFASAKGGRQAARVSYVRHFLKGKFEGCRMHASQAEMRRLIDTAAANATDFYERLLIEDLSERLAPGGKS